MVQGLPSLEHEVPAPTLPSCGQLVPLQTSATSHSPAAGRHVGAGLAAAAKSHEPLVHLFTVQTLLSSHTAHAPPALPHWPGDSFASVTHVCPLRQPEQHVRTWALGSRLQIPAFPPVVHAAPWVKLVWVQAPFEQPSVVHGLPSSQLRHWLPPRPHCAPDCAGGGTQLVPLRHPVQQLPPLHAPPGHGLPFGVVVDEHPAVVQVSSVHGLPSSQSLHVCPPPPQSFS